MAVSLAKGQPTTNSVAVAGTIIHDCNGDPNLLLRAASTYREHAVKQGDHSPFWNAVAYASFWNAVAKHIEREIERVQNAEIQEMLEPIGTW